MRGIDNYFSRKQQKQTDWDSLSMEEKSILLQQALEQGITDIDRIKWEYNNRNNPDREEEQEQEQYEPTRQQLYDLYNKVEGKRNTRKNNHFANKFVNGGHTEESTDKMFLTEFGTTKSHKGKSKAPKEIQLTKEEIKEIQKSQPYQVFDFSDIKDVKKRPLQEVTTFMYVPHSFIKKIYPGLRIPDDGNSVTYYLEESSDPDEKGRYTLHKLDLDSKMGKFYTEFKQDQEKYKKYMNNPNPYNLETEGIPLEGVDVIYDKKLNKQIFDDDIQPESIATNTLSPLIPDTENNIGNNGVSDKSYINPFGYTGREERLPIGDNNQSGTVGGHLFGENSGREILRDVGEGENVNYSYSYPNYNTYNQPNSGGTYQYNSPNGYGNQTVHINWPSDYTLPDYSGEYGVDPQEVPVDRLPVIEGDNINMNDLYYWLQEQFRRNNMSNNTYEEFALPKRKERIVPQLLTSLPLYESKVFSGGNLFKHGGPKGKGKKEKNTTVSKATNWYIDNKYAKYATNEFEYNGVKYATFPSQYGPNIKSIDYKTGEELGRTATAKAYYDEDRKQWKVIDQSKDKEHIENLKAHDLQVAQKKVQDDLEVARGTKEGEEKIVPYTTHYDGYPLQRLSYFSTPYSELYDPKQAAQNAYEYDVRTGHLPSVRASFKPADGYSDLDAQWYSANLPNVNVGINGGEYNDGSYNNGNVKYSKNASWNALAERSKDIIQNQWNQSKDAAEIKDRKISENIRKTTLEDNPGQALDLFVVKPGIMGLMGYAAATNPITTLLALKGFEVGSDVWNAMEAGIEPMDYLYYKSATGKDFESIKHLRGKTWDEKVQEALTPIIGEALAEEVAPFTNIGGLVGGGMGRFGKEFDEAGKDLISSLTSKRRANNNIFSMPENYEVRDYLDNYYKRTQWERTYKELAKELDENARNYEINGYVKVGDETPSNTIYTGSTYSYNNGKTQVPINNRTSTSTKLLAVAGDLNKESMRGAAASEVFKRPKLGKSLKEDYKPDIKEAKSTGGVEAVVEPEEITLNKSTNASRNTNVHNSGKRLDTNLSEAEIQSAFDKIIKKEQENTRLRGEEDIQSYYNEGRAVEDLMKAGASKDKAEQIAQDMLDNISTTRFNGFTDLNKKIGENVEGNYRPGYGKGKLPDRMTLDEYLNLPEEYRTFDPNYQLDENVINPQNVYENTLHELGGHGADLGFNMSETFNDSTLQGTHMLDALEGWFPSAREVYEHNQIYAPEVRPEFKPDSKEMKKLAQEDPEMYKNIMEYIEYLQDPAEYTARARANRISNFKDPGREIRDVKALREVFTDKSVDKMLNNVYSFMGDVNKESARGAALNSLKELNTKVKNKEIGVLDAMAKQEQIASELNSAITPNNQPLDWSAENWFKSRPKGQEPTPEEVAAFESRVPEYIDIQKNAGDNWLKMPDGSTWKGDPREWVMMQSKDYKNFMEGSKYQTPMTHLIGDFEGNQIKEVPSTGGGRLYGNGFYGYSNPTGELHTGLSTTSKEYPLIGAEPQATFVVNSKNPVGLTSIDVTPNIFDIGLRHSEKRVGSFHNPNFPKEGIGPYFDKDIGVAEGRRGQNIVVSGFPNSRGEAFPATKFITGNTGEFSTNPGSGVLRSVAGDLNEESIKGAAGKDIVKSIVDGKKSIQDLTFDDVADWTGQDWDTVYFDSLNKGNWGDVQHIRDMHHSSIFGDNQLVDENEMPIHQYHATDRDIENHIFDNNKIERTYYGYGHYTSPNVNYSHGWKIPNKRVIDLYGNSSRPFRTKNDGVRLKATEQFNIKNNNRFGKRLSDEEVARRNQDFLDEHPEPEYDNLMDELNSSDAVVVDMEKDTRNKFAEEAKQFGENYRNEVVFPTPNQLKSASAVTYDENGNIIPLSQRDNILNPNYLYSIFGGLNKESIRGAIGNASSKIGKAFKDAYRFGKGYRKELEEVQEKWRNARDESNKISTVDIPAENDQYMKQMASYKDRAMAQLENEEGKYISVPTSEISPNDLQTAANSNVFYGPKLRITEDGDSFRVTGGTESTASQKDYNIPIFDDNSSTVNRVTGTIEQIPYEETSNSIAVDPNNIESNTFQKIMEQQSPRMAIYKPSGAEQYLLDMGITEPSFTFEVSNGGGWVLPGRTDARGYTADRINTYNDYNLEPNVTTATKPVNVDVSPATVSGEVPELPKDLQQVAANNIEYIQKEIPGAVVYGSSKMTAEGVVARDFGDFDTYYPASKLKDLDQSRLGTSVNGATYPYQLDPVSRKYANRDENGRIKTNNKGEEDWGIVDLNIVEVDPKTGIGNVRAQQIYRQFFPEEWQQSVAKAAAEGKSEVPIVDMNGKPISDVELLSRYDPVDGTFMDAVEANFLIDPEHKGKHAGRFFNYMIGDRPDVIHNAFNRIAKMAFGKNGHLLPKLKFGTPEENYQILIGLNYPKNAAKIISKDPAKMQNALDYWYLSERTPFRATGPGDIGSATGTLETINRNATTWDTNAGGGTASGGGLNSVIGGTSGFERDKSLVIRSQPNIKGIKEGMKAEDAIAEINRAMGFGKLTQEDLDIAASLGIDTKRLKVGDDVSNMHSAIMYSASISKRRVEDIYNDFLDKTNRVGLVGSKSHTGTYFGSKNLNVNQGDVYGINAGQILGDKKGNYFDIMGLNNRSGFLKGQNITDSDIQLLYRSAATIKAKEKITKKLYEIFDNDKELLKIEQQIKDISKEIEKLEKDLKYSNKKMDRYSKLGNKLSYAQYKRDRVIKNMKQCLATIGLGTAVVGAGVGLAYTSSNGTSPAVVGRERRKNERDYNDLIKQGTNRKLSTRDNEKLEKIKMLSSVGAYDIPVNELKYWTKEEIRKLVRETKNTKEKQRKPKSTTNRR